MDSHSPSYSLLTKTNAHRQDGEIQRKKEEHDEEPLMHPQAHEEQQLLQKQQQHHQQPVVASDVASGTFPGSGVSVDHVDCSV